ncbi:hypothetical protein SAMN04488104_104418 [Algoriphagus faecimaris]|uniref:Uncharacterized protein n=1 Tax=Algoriphagus faecimaris TaxID=686796 RepID=A0A1G6WII9_9BACT|nr:hypothetical protein [Algoriphagus faecimaris]SDD65057.1 hypothetical protein SAMN04488104_104418 [Algoriphagus faecimaris]
MEVIYENLEEVFGIFNENFQYIFNSMYLNGVYNKMGLSFIAITLFVFAGFYFFYKNPYAKFFPHWVGFLLISGALSVVVTIAIAREGLAEYLLDSDPEVVDFANKMISFYTMMNLCLALIFGFLISFVLRLKSKVQPHLPF